MRLSWPLFVYYVDLLTKIRYLNNYLVSLLLINPEDAPAIIFFNGYNSSELEDQSANFAMERSKTSNNMVHNNHQVIASNI